MRGKILQREAARNQHAHQILAELKIFERWRAHGEPILVGAVAHGLVVAPDIDLEVYCPQLRIKDGFQVLRACALHPNTLEARFTNKLDGPDLGLYWQIRYQHTDGQSWKLDMWSLPVDHPGPTGVEQVDLLKAALTEQHRKVILTLKEMVFHDSNVDSRSIDIYRAVLHHKVHTYLQFKNWLEDHRSEGIVDWI